MDERAELERLRKLKRLRELEAKASSVPENASLGPFVDRALGMIQGAMAAPVTGKQAALDARNEQIRERQDLTGKAMKAVRDVQDIQRKRRVEPVERAAGQAGRAQLDQGPVTINPNVYLGPGSEFMLPPDAQRGMQAEREVYRANDVTSSLDAATIRGLNALAAGLPGILNKDFRGELAAAGEDQPGAALMGDIIGFLGPGALVETGLQGLSRAAQPIVSRLMPQGGSAIERTARVTGRAAGLAGSGATQSGVYQATVGESLAAGREDRAPSLAGAAEGFKTGATDPIAILALPAALGANRLLTYIASGGATATPANIAAQIDQATGRLLNPRRAIGQTLETSAVGADIRPQAMDRIIRELESAGLSVEDISRLMESVQQRLSSLPEAQASRLTFGQALAEATARDRPQALPTILATLRERRLSGRKGDTSAGIISGVTQDLERSQIDFLSDSISRNIGDTTLPEVDEQIRLARAAISQQYNQVLAQADPTRPEARGIAMIVAGDPSKGVLARRAKNAGFENVDAYIAARPDEAGHWLRSHLAKAGRTASGRERGELETTVSQLDELLETNEGYRQARMQWGHEAGLEEAQEWAKNFTNVARDEGAVADLLAELNRMPEAQRNVAMSSLRNEVLKSVRGGPEDASLRLSKWMTRGALDALEQLGEGGRALADDLRFLGREQRWLFKVDPETLSPTAVRMLSAQTAQQAGNAPVANLLTGAGQPGAVAQDVAISAIAGQAVPIMTTQRLLRGASNAIFRPRTKTLQDVARLYMGRRGNIPTPTKQPDFTPLFNRPPPAGGLPPAGGAVSGVPPQTPPQAPRTVGVAPAAAGAPVSPAGAPVPAPPSTSSPLATEWQQVMPQIGAARQVASDLRDAAATARSPDQIADVQTQLMLLRQQLQEVVTARGAGQTAEDLRLQEIVDALSVGGQDPRYLSALADEVANDLNAITQALNLVRTVGVPPPPVRGAGFALGPDTTNALAGGTLGGIAPAETPEERARNVAVGAGLGYVARPASQAVARVSDRVLGSGSPNLKGVDKKRQAYTFDVGGAKAKVTFEESFPDDGDYPRRVPTDIARLREDVRQEYLTPRQALDRSVEAIVPDRYNRGALGPAGPTRTLQDSVNVEMDISNANLTLPQTKQLFEKTFDTLEDHAIRHRRPVYYFFGAKPSQQTLYENSIKRRGAPKGYVATTGPNGFYFVRNDLFPNFAKKLQDDGYDVITRTVGAGRANPAPIVASGLPGLRTDATNAAFGAGMGALGPAETPEERLRNMAIGAGILGVGSRVGRTVGQSRAAGGRTVGMGSPYLNRRSMQLAAPRGPGEATLALREEWRPLMPAIATARATAEDAIRLAERARTPQQIEQAKAALGTLRNQVSEIRAARGGAATPEDQRIDDILDSLQPTSDPIFMATQASAARQSLDRLGQSLGFEQAGPRGRQALYDEALFDLRGDAPLGMNNAVKVVTEPVIAPDGTVLRKGVAEAVTGAELPISTGRAPPRTVLPRGADQPSEPRGPGRYAGGNDVKPQGFGAGGPKTPTQPAERFFSGLQKAIPTLKPEKATAEQWKGMLNNAPGVKKEELEWTGVMDWLDAQQGPVSKADLDAYVRGNGVTVEEVVKGAGRSGRDPRLNELERQMLPLIEESDRILLRQRELATKADNQTITKEEKAERSRNVKRLQEVDDLLVPLRQEQYNLSSRSGADTKWSSSTLPGGENYTELLLTLPMSEGSVPPGYKLFERDGRWILRYPDEMDVDFASRNEAIASISKKADFYRSSHWDEPNVLAHVRFKDRTGPNGERILAMEEIQSDWHQAGRKRGYKDANLTAEEKELQAFNKRTWSNENPLTIEEQARMDELKARGVDRSLQSKVSGVPNAPFKNEAWTNLALNRMIRKAAEEGYDGIAWIPGNIQNGSIVNAADNRGDFYDKIVVNAANKIGKKYGAKTRQINFEEAALPDEDNYTVRGNELDGFFVRDRQRNTVAEGFKYEEDAYSWIGENEASKGINFHYLPLTPELKRKALEEGFPLFAAAPFAAVGGAGMTMGAESERRTVGRPREKRTVGKAN